MKLDLSAEHTIYKTESGVVVPGVTTVLGVLDKGALLRWAAGMERELVLTHARAGTLDVLPARYAFEQARDSAADLGTVVHARIEAWLRDDELEPDGIEPGMYAASADGFARFRSWWEESSLSLVASERPLVHGGLEYGGTIDVVARDASGRLVLADIKTSNKTKTWPYPTVIAQVSAYKRLWDDVVGEADGRISRVVVCRVGKAADDPGQQVWLSGSRITNGFRLFKAARAAYDALKKIG